MPFCSTLVYRNQVLQHFGIPAVIYSTLVYRSPNENAAARYTGNINLPHLGIPPGFHRTLVYRARGLRPAPVPSHPRPPAPPGSGSGYARAKG